MPLTGLFIKQGLKIYFIFERLSVGQCGVSLSLIGLLNLQGSQITLLPGILSIVFFLTLCLSMWAEFVTYGPIHNTMG